MSLLSRRIDTFLSSRPFVRNVAVLASGTAFAQGLTLLTAPLITRIYSPEDLGALAVYGSIISIIVVASSLRYELAIPLSDSDETAANVFALSLSILVGVVILTGIGVWLLRDHIPVWTNTPSLAPYLWLLPFGLLGAGLLQIFSSWAVRIRAFVPLARSKLAQSIGQILTQILLGVMGIRPLGLLLGQLVGQTTSGLSLTRMMSRTDRTLFKKVSLARMRKAARAYRRFPLLASGSSLLNNAGQNLPMLLLAAIYGPEIAGWFALGMRVVGMPTGLMSDAVAQVYYSTAARLNNDNPADLLPFFLKTARRLVLIGVIPILLIMVVGPPLFDFVFGSAWQTTGTYIQILAPMFFVQFVVSAVSQTMFIIQRQDIQLAWDVMVVILLLIIFAVAQFGNVESRITIALYSIGMIFAYGCLFLIYYRTLRKHLKESEVTTHE